MCSGLIQCSVSKLGMAEFANRGIEIAALQAHRPGDEIKFYGVAGGGFFHWFYSGEASEISFQFFPLGDCRLPALPPLRASIFSGAT